MPSIDDDARLDPPPSDYLKYRGKCKEFCEELIKNDPSLTLVRGHYDCWSWGMQAHWWCVDKEGKIIDPTVDQFLKPHVGEYIPFNGMVECEQCHKQVKEEDAYMNGHHAYCSYVCAYRDVM